MKLYFARHGETESNLQKRVGCFGDRLTDNGRVQARQLAARVAGEAIDLIIASPYVRTKETAGIIAEVIGKDVLENALLAEKKWPGEIKGKLLNDPEVEKIFDLMREKNNLEPDWHYGDEENFSDIKKRAENFIGYVSGLGEKNILAVFHEYFIKAVIAAMIFGDKLTFDIFRSFFHSTCLVNTSLTICAKGQAVWKLVTLNNLPKS